jgi:aspartate/glutamate racemase
MTLDELLLTRESVAELIRLRQEYSKEQITRSNAPVIASGCTAVVVLIKDNVLYVANLETRDVFFREIIRRFRSFLIINLTISQRKSAMRERAIK